MYKNIFTALIAAYPVLVLAENIAPEHSSQLAALMLDDVTVTATRTPISTKTATGDITIIDRQEIERVSGGGLVDLLKLQPGIQILTNGGMGNAASVYMRGTNADQLVVLVDGIRINSATTGTTAFENLPLSLIDRIEILRGPASSLYGADAIGGVIQIFTRRGQQNKTLFYGNVGAGSYDTYTGNAGFDSKYKALQFGAQMTSYDTRGISAKKHPPGAIDKDRDGYNNQGGSAYATLNIADGHSLSVNFFETDGKNHYDSGFENYSTMHQQAYSATLKNRVTEYWNSTLKFGIGKDRSFNFDRPTRQSKFETEQAQLTWQHDVKLPVGVLTFAYDRLEQDILTSTNNTRNIDRTRNNDSFTLGYTAQHEAHSAQLSLREDHNTQYGNFVTGGVGYGYALSPQWQITAQYGSAFRAPTFNQLYFPNFGDPTLKPEKSDNFEASLRYQNTTVQAKLTVFDNHIRDLIQNAGPVTATCGASFAGFCPINAGKVEIQGVTAEGAYALNQQWQLTGNFTIQSPRNEDTDNLLARRSQRYGNLVLQYKSGDWDWSTEVTSASKRYDNAANTKVLAGYSLLNSTLSYKLNEDWRLQARANNILDKDYVLAASSSTVDYNTMGTNVFISLNYAMK